MLKKTVEYTNKLTHAHSDFSRERDIRRTNVTEVKALLGLLYLAGVLPYSHQNLDNLYSNDENGINVFFSNIYPLED